MHETPRKDQVRRRGGGNKESSSALSPSKARRLEEQQLDHEAAVSPRVAQHSNFSQQRLTAYQPVLIPRWVILGLVGAGIAVLVLGILILQASAAHLECKVELFGPEPGCQEGQTVGCIFEHSVQLTDCTSKSRTTFKPPVFVFYEIHNFYQNHRRYVQSKSSKQLAGTVFTSADDLRDCDPIITEDNENARILHPCGLVAASVFNDTFSFTTNGEPVVLHESREDITWDVDSTKFINPPKDLDDATSVHVYQWLDPEIFPGNIEDPHFIIWMRTAALPNFRKLYGRIDEEVNISDLDVNVKERWPVQGFDGKKFLVLSESSWIGGKNTFLGVTYVVVGGIILFVGIVFIIKNRRSPRRMGDVRYLKWTRNKRDDQHNNQSSHHVSKPAA